MQNRPITAIAPQPVTKVVMLPYDILRTIARTCSYAPIHNVKKYVLFRQKSCNAPYRDKANKSSIFEFLKNYTSLSHYRKGLKSKVSKV